MNWFGFLALPQRPPRSLRFKILCEKRKFLDLSIASLKEALAAGYDNFQHMRQDTDLTPLHNLPEFEALFPKPETKNEKKK